MQRLGVCASSAWIRMRALLQEPKITGELVRGYLGCLPDGRQIYDKSDALS